MTNPLYSKKPRTTARAANASQDPQNQDEPHGQKTKVGFLQLTKRGKGTYHAGGWHNGRHLKRSLRTTNLRVATQRANDLLTQLLQGPATASTAVAVGPQRHPIDNTITDYLAAKRSAGRAAKTLAAYRLALEHFKAFCDARLITYVDQIDHTIFDAYLVHLRLVVKHDKTLSNRVLNLLVWGKWLFTARSYATRSPFHGCAVPKAGEPLRFAPSIKQVNAILGKAPPELASVIRTLAYTGLRLNEFVHLRPSDIDLVDGFVHVRARLLPHPWKPKTNRDRMLPIHKSLRSTLAAAVTASNRASRPYLFSAPASIRYPVGNHHLKADKVNTKIQAVAMAAGILIGRANGGFVTHSLRRFFETTCVNARVPQVSVDRWMGHKTPGQSSSYYIQNAANEGPLIDSVTFE